MRINHDGAKGFVTRGRRPVSAFEAPRTQRLLVAAFVLSMLIHLFGGALWAHTTRLLERAMRRLPEQHAREQEVATSDAIQLERRTVPRPAVMSRARSPHGRLTKPAPSTASAFAREAHRSPQHLAPARPGAAARSSKPAAAAEAALSAAQLAQLNARFAKTITSTRVDLATRPKLLPARPAATRRYPLQFTGMQANLERGEGYIEPTSMGQRVGGTVWYSAHYTYMWPDGHLEDDDIPWPFRYPVRRDLFALHVHLIPLQLPTPGFHLARPVKPFLAQFLQRAGRI